MINPYDAMEEMCNKPPAAIRKQRETITEKPISRKKLIEYLKCAKVDTSFITNDHRYMYTTGCNMLADVLISGIMMGDFDED